MNAETQPGTGPEFDPFAGPALTKTAETTGPQREIWTATRLGDEASLSFNESVTLRLQGPLDVQALRAALAALVERHEALHTLFTADGLTLCVVPPVAPELPLLDFSGAGDPEALFRELTAREVREPFDLVRGPLFRARLAVLPGQDQRLTLTAHHLVCDGWSTAVLVRDLAALYSALVRGTPADLPPAQPFSDYAAASRSPSALASREADEAFWLRHLQGELPVLELPLDRPRPALKTTRSARIDAALDEELVSRLRKTFAKERASLFAGLLAGFQALLHRLSAQEDLVIGIPAAGQAARGADALVGHCVNLLPLRARPRPEMPFRELLAATRAALLEALEHQELSFGDILTRLSLPRDPSRLPLVSVLYNLDRGLPAAALRFEGLLASLSTNPRAHENFELFLNAVELDGRILLECQYNEDLFDAATVRRWLAGYERLLRSAADDPGAALGALAVAGEEERTLLARWNDSAAPFPQVRVHELIEAQAARTPQAVAVQLDASSLTYAQLDERANQVARRLRALSLGEGALVGLCLERSLDLIVGLLGILKAGAAYVPLDPGYPADRLAFMVTDSRMPALVTSAALRERLQLPVAQTVCVEDPEIAAQPTAPLQPTGSLESAAYVIYTSGSTGKPKGVVVPHRSVVNLIESVRQRPGMTAKDVVLAVTTLSFDIAVSEILLPLTVGARIVLATREVASDGLRLLQLLDSSGATFLDATPATWRLLLAAGWERSPALTAICTGEAMPKDLAIDLVGRVGSLWNGYGPTETTVWSSFWQVTAPVTRVLIGRPVANTQLHVLDPRGNPAPLGVPGELFIGGSGVTLGYLHRPELTAERFVKDPFSSSQGARMYRTGDVARWVEGGELEYLGRNDNQVKLRGYRIELGEIEHALAQHAGVAQAAAVVREDRPGDRRLVAYVTAKAGRAPDEKELRAFLKGTLPDYMVPAAFVALPALPLTPSGKVDRKALPRPELPEAAQAVFVAPRTEAERVVAEAFREALGVGRVGVDDDFFALGGHSLLASQVLARLRKDHGVTLAFRTLFEAPTAAKLGAHLEANRLLGAQAAPAGIPKHTGPAVLSLMQERLWLLEEMDDRQRFLHGLPAAWRLRGPLDEKVVSQCLATIVSRHEPLRTSFQREDGRPVPVIAQAAAIGFETVDLSEAPAEHREGVLLAMLSAQGKEPHGLTRAPLLRVLLVALGHEDHALFILPHNLVWDGWSFDVFLRELTVLYPAYLENRAAGLPDLPIAYSDFAAWHRAHLESPEMERQRAFWIERLQGATELSLPTDRPRTPDTGYLAGNTGTLLPPALLQQLTTLAREQSATLFMVVFAAFNTLLHRYTGQTDLLVATPVRARTQAETEPLIGLFVNALALRTRLSPSWSFVELLSHVRDELLDAFSHQEVPMEALGNHAKAVRAFFSLQDARGRPAQLGPMSVEQLHVNPPGAANDLTLWMMEGKAGLLARLNYRKDLFDPGTAERLLAHFRTLLESVVRDPRRPLSELLLVPQAERRQLEEFGAPAAPPPACAHELLARTAAQTPDAVALREGARSMTYAELSARSAAVAAALRGSGVAARERVAVLLPAGAARAVALFGIWQAGCVTVSLDPAHPRARLEAILADAAAAALVSSELLLGRVTWTKASLVVSAFDAAAQSPAEGDKASAAVSPDDPALVDYGWAGKPRGVQLSHRALAATAVSARQALGLAAADVLLSAAPPSVAVSVLEVLLPVCAGAAADFTPPEAAVDAQVLLGELERTSATALFAPPALWRRLLGAGWQGGPSFLAVSVGAPPPPELATELAGRAGRAFAAFGAPEVGGWALVSQLARDATRCVLGRVLAGHRARILDRHGQQAPLGVPGELHVGVEDRLHRTGVRARWLPEGRVELVANDPAAVEPGYVRLAAPEVAALLREHPALADAAVVVREAAPFDQRLVAYVVRKAGTAATDTELRQHLRRMLPEGAGPQLFVEVKGLARDAVGEVVTGSLPDPFKDAGDDFVPARSEEEKLIAGLFCEALSTPRVSVHDNFFALGGHSLSCFQVIAKIEQATGVRLSPRVLLLDSLEQAARRVADERVAAQGAAPRKQSESPQGVPGPAGAQGGLAGRMLGKLRKMIVRE